MRVFTFNRTNDDGTLDVCRMSFTTNDELRTFLAANPKWVMEATPDEVKEAIGD